MRHEIWQHYRSGEWYVVTLNDSDKLIDAVGPLHYSDVLDCIQHGYDGDVELTDHLIQNQEEQSDYITLTPSYLYRLGHYRLASALAQQPGTYDESLIISPEITITYLENALTMCFAEEARRDLKRLINYCRILAENNDEQE